MYQTSFQMHDNYCDWDMAPYLVTFRRNLPSPDATMEPAISRSYHGACYLQILTRNLLSPDPTMEPVISRSYYGTCYLQILSRNLVTPDPPIKIKRIGLFELSLTTYQTIQRHHKEVCSRSSPWESKLSQDNYYTFKISYVEYLCKIATFHSPSRNTVSKYLISLV
jgi:hypothetical protein